MSDIKNKISILRGTLSEQYDLFSDKEILEMENKLEKLESQLCIK